MNLSNFEHHKIVGEVQQSKLSNNVVILIGKTPNQPSKQQGKGVLFFSQAARIFGQLNSRQHLIILVIGKVRISSKK
jgi:hypothetical protein